MAIPEFELNTKSDMHLFDDTALKVAKELVENKYKGVSRHQFRRIFDEVKTIHRRYDNFEEENWKLEVLPLVKMIKAKTAYLVARMKTKNKNNEIVRRCYENLSLLMKKGINQVNDKKSFNLFTNFLEAVYAFYYELGGSELER